MSLELDNLDDFDSDKTQSIELEEYGVWVKKETPEFTEDILSADDIFNPDFLQDTTQEPPQNSEVAENTENPVEDITETIPEDIFEENPVDIPVETEVLAESDLPEGFDIPDLSNIGDIDLASEPVVNQETPVEPEVSPESDMPEGFDIPDLANIGDIDISAFMSDFEASAPAPKPSTPSSNTTEEVSLDDFMDFTSEFVSLDDFITPTEEKNDIIGDEPLDIQLSFDDNYALATGANPLEEMETDFVDGFLPTGDDILDNFDDIFDSVTDIAEPEVKDEAKTVTEDIAFDTVDDFDDLLASLSDAPPSTENIIDKNKKVTENNQYDISVNLEEDNIIQDTTPEIDDNEEDFNVSLFSDDDINNNLNKDDNQNIDDATEATPMINNDDSVFSIADLDDSISFVDETPMDIGGIPVIDETLSTESAENDVADSGDLPFREMSSDVMPESNPDSDNPFFPIETTFVDNGELPYTEDVKPEMTPETELPAEDSFVMDTNFAEEPAFADDSLPSFEEPVFTEEPAVEEEHAFTEEPVAFDEPAFTEETVAFEEPVAEEMAETEAPTDDSFVMDTSFVEEPAFADDSMVSYEEPATTEEPVAFDEPAFTEEAVTFEEPVGEEMAETEVPADDSFVMDTSFVEEPSFADDSMVSYEEPATTEEPMISYEEPVATEENLETTQTESPLESFEVEDPFAVDIEQEVNESFLDEEVQENEKDFVIEEALPTVASIAAAAGVASVAGILSTLDNEEESEIVDMFENQDTLENTESEEIEPMNQDSSSDLGNSLLEKIVNELSVLRSEMASIKQELDGIKSVSEESEVIIQDEIIPVQENTTSGFFSDDEDDETIALSGDELNNILNTADFTEENACDSEVEEDSLEEEIDTEIDTVSIDEEDEEIPDDDLSIDESVISDETCLDATLEYHDDISEEITIEEDIEDELIPDETLSLQDDETLSLHDDENFYEDSDSPALDISNEEIVEPELNDINFDDQIDDIPAEIPGDEEDFVVDSSSNDFLAEKENVAAEPVVEEIEEVVEPVEALECEETEDDQLLSVLDEDDDIDDEPTTEVFNSQWDSIQDICESAIAAEEEKEESEYSPVSITLEELNNARLKAETEEVDVNADLALDEPTETTSAASVDTLPEDLKKDVKSVLEYMDNLLESLPDEKIKEFAKSEHFEVYKKLFTELGLA